MRRPRSPRRPASLLVALVLVLTVPVLAGCTSNLPQVPGGGNGTGGNGGSGPIGHPGSSKSLDFAAPVQLGGVGSGEPSVRAGPDGTLWVAAPAGLGAANASLLWKSTDGGATWSSVTPGTLPGGNPGGGDSAIAVPTAKTIYYATLWLGSVTVAASHDGGKTWTNTNPVAGLVPGEDRQWIAAKGDQDAWMVYKDVGTSSLMLVSTTNGGLLWSNPQVLATSINYVGGLHVAPDGSLFAVYNTAQGTFLAISKDGSSWNSTKVNDNAKPTAIFPVAAADADGNLYVAWNAPTSGNGGQALYLQASSDGGKSWTSPVQVNPKGTTAVLPWIAAGAGGHVVLAWYEAGSLVTPGQAPNSTRWYLGVADVLHAQDPGQRSIAAGHGAKDPVHLGQICTGGLGCSQTSGDRRLADFLQDAFTPDGHVIVAYTDTAHQQDGQPRIRVVVGTES